MPDAGVQATGLQRFVCGSGDQLALTPEGRWLAVSIATAVAGGKGPARQRGDAERLLHSLLLESQPRHLRLVHAPERHPSGLPRVRAGHALGPGEHETLLGVVRALMHGVGFVHSALLHFEREIADAARGPW